MKKNVIKIISLVGIISSLGMLLACGPVGRALVVHATAAAVTRGVENAVDENYTHSADCPHCGARISWKGRATKVRCANCQKISTVDPRD